ncbi:MAG: Calx-beta domain-containing protein [Singulisphaera sp.]
MSVDFATADGGATLAGGDYRAASGTLTFAAGQTSKIITVLVNGDRLGEYDETFYVVLTNAVGAAIANGTGYATILDDEPRLSVNSVSKVEGHSGTTVMTFTVTLSAAYDQAVTVNYATGDGTATVAGGDYVATSGTLTFAAGQTTRTFTVTIKGDKKKEADEYFSVVLSGASSNAMIWYEYGTGTILTDDGGGAGGLNPRRKEGPARFTPPRKIPPRGGLPGTRGSAACPPMSSTHRRVRAPPGCPPSVGPPRRPSNSATPRPTASWPC